MNFLWFALFQFLLKRVIHCTSTELILSCDGTCNNSRTSYWGLSAFTYLKILWFKSEYFEKIPKACAVAGKATLAPSLTNLLRYRLRLFIYGGESFLPHNNILFWYLEDDLTRRDRYTKNWVSPKYYKSQFHLKIACKDCFIYIRFLNLYISFMYNLCSGKYCNFWLLHEMNRDGRWHLPLDLFFFCFWLC